MYFLIVRIKECQLDCCKSSFRGEFKVQVDYMLNTRTRCDILKFNSDFFLLHLVELVVYSVPIPCQSQAPIPDHRFLSHSKFDPLFYLRLHQRLSFRFDPSIHPRFHQINGPSSIKEVHNSGFLIQKVCFVYASASLFIKYIWTTMKIP